MINIEVRKINTVLGTCGQWFTFSNKQYQTFVVLNDLPVGPGTVTCTVIGIDQPQSLDTDMQRLFYSTWPSSFSFHIDKRWTQNKTGVVHWYQATVRSTYLYLRMSTLHADNRSKWLNTLLFTIYMQTSYSQVLLRRRPISYDIMTDQWHK